MKAWGPERLMCCSHSQKPILVGVETVNRDSPISNFEDFFYKKKVESKSEKDMIKFSFEKDH